MKQHFEYYAHELCKKFLLKGSHTSVVVMHVTPAYVQVCNGQKYSIIVMEVTGKGRACIPEGLTKA